jgi:hypothetical protein
MSYAVNIAYTDLGRVEVKIQVMADDHQKALDTAQTVLNQQKNWYRKHKQEASEEQQHYKKLLRHGPDDYKEEEEPHEQKEIRKIGSLEDEPPLYPAVFKTAATTKPQDGKGVF